MQPKIICILPSRKEAAEAVSRVRREGYADSDLIVAEEPSEIDSVLRPDTDFFKSTIRGACAGAAIGFALAVAQLIYMDSYALNHWNGVLSIPIFNALGWGLYGMIAGGTGIFAKGHIPADIERSLEEKAYESKVLMAVRLRDVQEANPIQAALAESGATEIRMIGVA